MSPQFVRSLPPLQRTEKHRGKTADYDSFLVDLRLTFFTIIAKGRDEVLDSSKPKMENARSFWCFGLH